MEDASFRPVQSKRYDSSRLYRAQTVRFAPKSSRKLQRDPALSPPRTPMNDEPPPYRPSALDPWSLNMLPAQEKSVYYSHPHPSTPGNLQYAQGCVEPASAYLKVHTVSKNTINKEDSMDLTSSTSLNQPVNIQRSEGYVRPSRNWMASCLRDESGNVQYANGYVPISTAWLRNRRPKTCDRDIKKNGCDDHARLQLSRLFTARGYIEQPRFSNSLTVKEPSPSPDSILPNIDAQMVDRKEKLRSDFEKANLTRRKDMDAMNSAFKFLESPSRDQESPSEPIAPREIRLRRPSTMPRKDLPPVGSVLQREKQSSTDTSGRRRSSLANSNISLKSEIAYEAVTHTAVHFSGLGSSSALTRSPSKDCQDQSSQGTTLQVVRSRDSVYEVIWTDRGSSDFQIDDQLTQHDSADPEEVSSAAVWSQSPQDVLQQSPSSRNLVQVSSRLATWSWGLDQERSYRPRSEELDLPPAPSSTPAYTTHSKVSSQRTSPDRFMDSSSLPSNVPEDYDEGVSSSSESGASFGFPFLRKFRRSDSESPSQSGVTPHRCSTLRPPKKIFTEAQRRNLLGSRRLSDMPSEDDHLRSHRDSLKVAHKLNLRQSQKGGVAVGERGRAELPRQQRKPSQANFGVSAKQWKD